MWGELQREFLRSLTTRKHAKDPLQKYWYEDEPVPMLDGTYGRALGTDW